MKLFWKLMLGIMTIFLLTFPLFGTILLQTSFRTALEREKENGLEELRCFQYSFLSSLEELGDHYIVDEEMLRTLAESVGKNLLDSRCSFCLYYDTGTSIYPVGQRAGKRWNTLKQKKSDENCLWELTEEKGNHVLKAMVKMESGEKIYGLEVTRNIQNIYDSRREMYQNYRISLLALFFVTAGFAGVLAGKMTRPLRKLSQATREFSEGNYDRRVKPEGKDEVALLMQDFNYMADELQDNIDELKEAARRQEEFTGAFAHELKTPLTSMIGYGEMLLMRELTEEERTQAASYIYRESKRLEKLSYKMMELICLGKGTIIYQPVNILSLLEQLEKTTGNLLREKEITLCCRAEKGSLEGDFDLLLSLLVNLVDNGRKACREGGHILVCGGHEGEGQYRITVADDGCGIPKEELGKITEAFYMVDKSRARREGSAGLGMAICERIVRLHHAQWKIESTVGEGTTVSILFQEMNSGKSKDRVEDASASRSGEVQHEK